MEQTIARFLATSAAALALAVPVQAHAGGSRSPECTHVAPARPAASTASSAAEPACALSE